MQNLSFPHSALADLHGRLDKAMTVHDPAAISQVRACASWLAELEPTVPIRQLEARATAASRFVAGGRRHG